MATEKLSNEGSLQKEAFEFYYHLGSRRSLKQVAEKFERTERTVAGWSRSFNWVARVQQREIEEAKNLNSSGNINVQTTEVRTRYRIMVNNLFAKASAKIASGELAINNIQDFERMVKLDLLLMGEATEKLEQAGTTELTPADKERLDKIAKLLSGGKKS